MVLTFQLRARTNLLWLMPKQQSSGHELSTSSASFRTADRSSSGVVLAFAYVSCGLTRLFSQHLTCCLLAYKMN